MDFLCIIQNGVEDWLAESATMVSMYAALYIITAASGAENTRTGQLVEKRRATAQVSCPSNGKSLGLSLKKAISHGLCGKNMAFREDPEE